MSDYEKAHARYRELVKKAQGGDAQAHAEKAKAMNEIKNIEREAARAGTILNAVYQGDKIVTQSSQTSTKRSLQEEYVRKFNDQVKVSIPDKAGEEPKEQTLREFHSKRLLKK